MQPRHIVPGLALAIAVALVARLLHGALPPGPAAVVGDVVVAIFLGLLVSNLVRLPAALRPGIRFSFQTVLRLAIVLLGARLSVAQVLAIGGKALVLIVLLMGLALVLAHQLGRLVGISPRLASLIGVGTAVCGNSAISAVAPVIGAEDEEVSFAIATNTLFGTLAVFLYPLLGHALGLSDGAYGTWAGTAVNDTSQVVAAGAAFSAAAGDVANTVKLTRNALMGAVIVLMGFLHRGGAAASARQNAPPGGFATRLRQSLPGFVLGFLAMAALSSLGAFHALSGRFGFDLAAVLGEVAKALILVALAAVGLSTRFTAMGRIGWRPFLIGFAVALATSGTSLLLIHLLGPAGG